MWDTLWGFGIVNTGTKVELPGFCKILPKQWFNQRESRFDEACLEHKLESGTPSTVPHPFMKCSNPLEVIAAIAICVSMVSILKCGRDNNPTLIEGPIRAVLELNISRSCKL